MLVKAFKGLLFAFLVGFCFLRAMAYGSSFPKVPQELVEEIMVKAEDGVDLKLWHLSRPGKPIVLLNPGLGAQGLSLEIPATKLWETGEFDVFVSNWRGSVKLDAPYKMLNPNGPNGLNEVLRYDFSAHLRFILNQYANDFQRDHGISVLGHSMGGMMIAGTLTDDARKAEFLPFLKSVTLFQSPHHLKYLLPRMNILAKAGTTLVDALRKNGLNSIDMHSKYFELSRQYKSEGGLRGAFVIPALESMAMEVVKLAISPAHTGRNAFRRAFFKMPAYSVPLDLLEGFRDALVSQSGLFHDKNGELLIDASKISGVPVLVVRSDLDTLAPMKEQKEYYEEIGSFEKVQFTVHEINHVDSVLATRDEIVFFNSVIDFMRDPLKYTGTHKSNYKLVPECDSLLKRLAMKVRLRGI